jgi:hypothetical protein
MDQIPAANSVTLERTNLVRVVVAGSQTGLSVAETREQVVGALASPEADRRVDILIDLRAKPTHNLAARVEARNFLVFLRDHRIAIFGADHGLKTVVGLIIKGSGLTGKVGNFDTEAEALEWLKR